MSRAIKEIKQHGFKDPGSAVTHLIGMLLSMLASFPLLIKAQRSGDSRITVISLAVFMVSMILLYGASTTYHSLDINPAVNKILRKIDHMMIFVLIAGTYTPICLAVMGDSFGWKLLGLVWVLAALGMILKLCWITCPKWLSSAIYIGMGWMSMFAMSRIAASLPLKGIVWFVLGGVIYTIGGVIYALKLPVFNSLHKNFGSHEIFHLFVMAGSFCHYMMMLECVA